MACFIVTFELNDVSKLGSFKEGLKSFNGFCPLNTTSWAITTDKSAKEVRDHLTTLIGHNDCLFVIRSGTEGAWRNSYGKENDEWLKKYL